MQRLSEQMSRSATDSPVGGFWSGPSRWILTIGLMFVGTALIIAGRPDREGGGPGVPDLVLDLNEAPAGVLSSLPGVGRNLARRIVAERDARPFASPVELRHRTPGVGPGTFARLAPHLRAQADPDRLARLE